MNLLLWATPERPPSHDTLAINLVIAKEVLRSFGVAHIVIFRHLRLLPYSLAGRYGRRMFVLKITETAQTIAARSELHHCEENSSG